MSDTVQSVKVTLVGDRQTITHAGAPRFSVKENGQLAVIDNRGILFAVYAAGCWSHAVITNPSPA